MHSWVIVLAFVLTSALLLWIYGWGGVALVALFLGLGIGYALILRAFGDTGEWIFTIGVVAGAFLFYRKYRKPKRHPQ